MYAKRIIYTLSLTSLLFIIPASHAYAVSDNIQDVETGSDLDTDTPDSSNDDSLEEKEETPSAGAEDTSGESSVDDDPVSSSDENVSGLDDNENIQEENTEGDSEEKEENLEDEKKENTEVKDTEKENKDDEVNQDNNNDLADTDIPEDIPDENQMMTLEDTVNTDLFFEKDFADYTVTEGLVLLIFVLVFCKFCIDMTAKILHWRMF